MTKRPVILAPFAGADYVTALRKAGADVRTIVASEDPVAELAAADGVLLTGGRDIDPACYGQQRHPSTQDSEPGRDKLELTIAQRAMADDVPILAICRGMQVLNVAGGGTLVQDIPTEIGKTVTHNLRKPADGEAHPVRVKAGSRLARALDGEVDESGNTQVNSRHHQALATIAPGLEVTAVAPDGLPEAIEKPGATFCVGVQWHPENFHASGRFHRLFAELVQAAASFATSASGQKERSLA